MYKIGTNMIKK